MSNRSDNPNEPAPRRFSIARIRALVAAVDRRAGRADPSSGVTLSQVEELLTGASALRLSLAADQQRTARQLEQLHARGVDEDALPEVERASARAEMLEGELARLDELIGQLQAVHTGMTGAGRA